MVLDGSCLWSGSHRLYVCAPQKRVGEEVISRPQKRKPTANHPRPASSTAAKRSRSGASWRLLTQPPGMACLYLFAGPLANLFCSIPKWGCLSNQPLLGSMSGQDVDHDASPRRYPRGQAAAARRRAPVREEGIRPAHPGVVQVWSGERFTQDLGRASPPPGWAGLLLRLLPVRSRPGWLP